jgi:SAM-dependent methyltransferase
MTQNIYDNQDFFDGYSRLNRSVEGLDGAPEWPALRALLPDLRQASVVDLGCGYGWFSRWAREQGARSVLGLDISDKMLDQARALTEDEAITYDSIDLEMADLPEASYDLAYSSLAFHYIEDLAWLWESVHRALVPGGRMVFCMEHPIYLASMHPGWIEGSVGRKVWPVDSYQVQGRRITDWLGKAVVKQHRTLGSLLNLLIKTGFSIAHVEEWGPTEAQVTARPELVEEKERPMLLLVAVDR